MKHLFEKLSRVVHEGIEPKAGRRKDVIRILTRNPKRFLCQYKTVNLLSKRHGLSCVGVDDIILQNQ